MGSALRAFRARSGPAAPARTWVRPGEWLWLSLFGLVIVAIGVTAGYLIRTRIAVIDAGFSAMAADHLLANALHAAVQLQMLAAQADDPGAGPAMAQAMAALASLTQGAGPLVQPRYAPAGAEVDALRALIPSALDEIMRLRSLPDAAILLPRHIDGLERDILALAERSSEAVARHGARLAETAFIPHVIRVLLGVTLLLLLVFVTLLLRSRARLRKANQALSGWAEDTAGLLAAMPGVLIRSRRGADGVWRRSFVGAAVAELTGHSAEEALREEWWPANTAPHMARHGQAFAADQHTAPPTEREFAFRHKLGHWIWIRHRSRAYQAQDGLLEMVSVWNDVTHEKRLAEQLAQSAKLAQLGEVATGMAHELNQPLAGISLAAENALYSLGRVADVPTRVLDKLELIISLAMRASETIDHMRIFGRTGTGPSRPVPLAEMLAGAEGLVRAKLKHAGVSLVCQLPADAPAVFGKSIPLEQVMINLISNACDAYAAMEPGLPAEGRVITISARVADDRVGLIVQDHAGGIPDEILSRIFEPFFTTKAAGQGTGLGLSISYGIITDMGGTIAAERAEGGTRFTIELPAAAPEP